MSDGGWLASGGTSSEDVLAYYESLASDYDATLDSWGYTAPQRAADLLLSALRSDSTDRHMLDAGCGTGLVGRALRDAGFTGRLSGIDVSPQSLQLAHRRGVYDELGEGDLQRPLTAEDDTYDGVVCVGVLTYVPDVLAAWAEFCRVVRPGGAIVCTQRDDLWRSRRTDAALHALEADARWTVTHLSGGQPYLPDHADFGDEILVRYVVARVRQR